jgi:hypothetical protein
MNNLQRIACGLIILAMVIITAIFLSIKEWHHPLIMVGYLLWLAWNATWIWLVLRRVQ